MAALIPVLFLALLLAPADSAKIKKELFQTSDRCFACHNGLSTSGGEDISIGFSWRPTMMANSARDPYWQAGVRRESIDHAESKAAIEDECSKCHMPITTALGPGGQKIGELPEQMPYQEWLNSDFKDKQTCQNCHMPVVDEMVRVTNTLGKFREGMSRHVFVGGNFFIQRVLNKYRADLGVIALPEEFEAAASRTIEHLKSKTAQVAIDRLEVTGGRVRAEISVQNLSGHKFPTAYPSRRAWLHVAVKDRDGQGVFESGALNSNGSIQGNDNDADPNRFEPHYTEINNAEQVQIYEDIMVGANNMPTTGLLTAVRFIKDNRLLPKGFNKNPADARIAPQGGAATDADFVGGGDKIVYSVPVGNAQGPFQVEAEFWFQPISFRWANNLKPYDAPEPKRFTGYYDAMAPGSAVMLVRAAAAR